MNNSMSIPTAEQLLELKEQYCGTIQPDEPERESVAMDYMSEAVVGKANRGGHSVDMVSYGIWSKRLQQGENMTEVEATAMLQPIVFKFKQSNLLPHVVD